jgi:N utilization substance protein A
MSIKFNANEIRYIALFESMTGAMVKDCIIDEENGKVTFVVKNGDMGLAIGKKGATVTKVQNAVDKGVEIVEHSEDVTEFMKNIFSPAQIKGVKVLQKEGGEKIATILTDGGTNKRLAIGKNGINIERAKLLAKRQHNISNIVLK